jgi:hypothetical protein
VGNSLIFDNGTNVGIGTASPGTNLHVKGAGAYAGIRIDNTGTTGGGFFASYQNGSQIGIVGVSGAVIGDTSSNMALFSETGKSIDFMSGGTADIRMRITSDGTLEFLGAATGLAGAYITNNNTNFKIHSTFGGETTKDLILQSGGSSGAPQLILKAGGNVLIGTTTDNGQKLQVGGGNFRLNGLNANSRFILYENYSGNSVGIQMFNTSGVNVIDFNSNVGSGTFSGTLTASNFISSSDRRLKSEIKEIKDAVLKLSKFKAYEYIKDNKQDAGFIAQEVQKVLPYSVFEMDSGYLSMNDRPILALIHQAIIEINERLTKLENK